MLTNKILNFPHKAILTREVLQEIYKYPREFFRLIYSDYADGIICGLNYFIDEEKNLNLSPGMILSGGEIYFLEESVNVSELAEKNNLTDGRDYYIFPQKESQKKSPCLTENKLVLTFGEEDKNFSLGKFRFKSKNDFNLPTLSNNENPFENIFRPSTFDLFDVPYADKGEATFHPQLFEPVKNFLASKENKTPLDYSILTHLQNHEIISLQTIEYYIAEQNSEDTFENRKELFQTFCDCLLTSEFKIKVVQIEDDHDEPLKSFRGKGRRI